MATPVLLPKLDMTMTQGTLSRWHKQEGDRVEVGDVLFEVEADKSNMDIEAPAAGILRGVACAAGARLPVGTVVAYVLAEGEALPEAERPREPESAPAKEAAGVRATPAARRLAREQGIELTQVEGTGPASRIQAVDVKAHANPAAVRVTPLAAKVAADLSIDLRDVQGTGAGGKVMKADVEQAVADRSAAAQIAVAHAPDVVEAGAIAPVVDAGRVPLAGVRAVIARRMTESWQQTPHVTLTLEADCSELVRMRHRLAAGGPKLSYNTLIAYFTVRTLVKFQALNTTWDGQDLVRHAAVHLAIATDTPGGLLVPVVRHSDNLGLEGLHSAIADLAGRARSGRVTPGEMAGGTFTLSNLGSFGIEAFTPIINQPQVAILGVGAITDKVVPVDGTPAIRPRLTLSLSFDHRALDGADGARFLAHLRSLIECPERALL